MKKGTTDSRIAITKDGRMVCWALDGTESEYAPPYYGRRALYRNGWKADDECVCSKDVLRSSCYKTYSMRLFHDESQFFTERSPKLIQVLLSMIIGEPIILTGVETENIGDRGYPLWLFYYRKPAPEDTIRMKAEFYDILVEQDKTYEEDMAKRKALFDSIFSNMVI